MSNRLSSRLRLYGPLIATLVAMICFGAAPAHATFAGKNGKIALGSNNFTTAPDFNARNQFVFSINADGSDAALVADNDSGRAAWAPAAAGLRSCRDSSRVAVTRI